jgi:hypothetical protein
MPISSQPMRQHGIVEARAASSVQAGGTPKHMVIGTGSFDL